MKSEYTTLYIVRHGETDWNVKEIVQGQSDQPALTKEGKKQVQDLAKKFKNIYFDIIFSSDLSRAKETAQIINLERKLVINTNKLLREKSLGRHEGKLLMVYREENKEALEKIEHLNDRDWWNFKVSEDEESNDEIIARFLTILREISVTYIGKTILVVTHGGVMRALLVHLGWANYKQLTGQSVKNAGYIVLKSDGIEFIIKEVVGVGIASGLKYA